MNRQADVIVIGAGIAGASVAAFLAAENHVILLEMEGQPGYHTTGRSAALFAPTYGPSAIRALTRASERFFETPPIGFCAHDLLSPRGFLMIAQADRLAVLETEISDVVADSPNCGIIRLDADQVLARQPLLRPGFAAAGSFDQSARDIDVNALHQGFLGQFRALGGVLHSRAAVGELVSVGGTWQMETPQGRFSAPLVVNAAGAWADEVGAMAGATPIGLTPKRRTALIVAPPPDINIARLPITADVDEQFYLKPDAGRLLISPADETPSAPCDAQPEELDVAVCIDRIETAFDIKVRRIENKWAGLRSFVQDKCPVVGFSQTAEGFFWLAGQGGYGIQTSPALGQLAAALVKGRPVPQQILDHGLDLANLSPDRLTAPRHQG